MKKLALLGMTLCILFTTTHAQKKESKAATQEVKKEKKATKASTATNATNASTAQVANKAKTESKTTTVTTASKDKEVGKDAQGRIIYEGPKGGRYYLKDGKKVYIKK
jgi:colicin import membrane protein